MCDVLVILSPPISDDWFVVGYEVCRVIKSHRRKKEKHKLGDNRVLSTRGWFFPMMRASKNSILTILFLYFLILPIILWRIEIVFSYFLFRLYLFFVAKTWLNEGRLDWIRMAVMKVVMSLPWLAFRFIPAESKKMFNKLWWYLAKREIEKLKIRNIIVSFHHTNHKNEDTEIVFLSGWSGISPFLSSW